jgi:hypothetical protein
MQTRFTGEKMMGISATALQFGRPAQAQGKWIYKRQWDLAFISLSALLVPLPYLVWLFMDRVLAVEPDLARQIVNLLVIIIVAGPHTYATFSRTLLDDTFRQKHTLLFRSAILIPAIVIVLALANLTLLLMVFFAWASLHTLHQIVFIVDAYNEKENAVEGRRETAQSTPRLIQTSGTEKWWVGAIDYAAVVTALYPVAAYRIAITKDFSVGPNNINDVIPSFFEQPWLLYLAATLFGLTTLAFIAKSIWQLRNGRAHLPKILFVSLTIGTFFVVPSLGNLDTAFQGINVWHCTQYLALTWYINRLRVERGEMKRMPFLERISQTGQAKLYYGFNLGLTLGSLLLIGLFYLILNAAGGKWAEPSYAFETAYYIGVLAFLWIHYYHDHFLFTQPETVMP